MVASNVQHLSEAERHALAEIKQRVSARFEVRRYILFGSKARGDYAPDSDVDLLIVTGRPLAHRERHAISDQVLAVNLKYDTSFSYIAVDAQAWNSKLYSFYPIHKNIVREGIVV